MFFTIVPCLTTDEAPLIFKSLITETSSPSINTFPLASRYIFSFGVSSNSVSLVHSFAHVEQTIKFPSSLFIFTSHLSHYDLFYYYFFLNYLFTLSSTSLLL